MQWDDGDATGRTVPYSMVALNEAPDADAVAVRTKVIFPQGRYRIDGVSGVRYHLGKVLRASPHHSGARRFAGHHLLTPEQGKMPFREYTYAFDDLALGELRIPPNAFDAVLAGL